MARSVSFKKAILPLFTQEDIDHMIPFGVKLNDYAWMSDPAGGTLGSAPEFKDHAHARAVYAYLTGEAQPRMPLGGPYWHKDCLDMYCRWMDDGFQP